MWDVRVIYTASCGMLMLPLNVSSQWASLDWRQYFFPHLAVHLLIWN